MEEKFKDLFCKNDDCMRLLAQVRKIEAKPGIIFRVKCHRCGEFCEWRFGYSQLEEEFGKLKYITDMKGGENFVSR